MGCCGCSAQRPRARISSPCSARHRPAKRQRPRRRSTGRRVCPWPASWRRSASGSGSARSPSPHREGEPRHAERDLEPHGDGANRLCSDRHEPGNRRDPLGELAAVARAPARGRSRFVRRRLGGQGTSAPIVIELTDKEPLLELVLEWIEDVGEEQAVALGGLLALRDALRADLAGS